MRNLSTRQKLNLFFSPGIWLGLASVLFYLINIFFPIHKILCSSLHIRTYHLRPITHDKTLTINSKKPTMSF